MLAVDQVHDWKAAHAAWFLSELVENPEDRFCCVAAQTCTGPAEFNWSHFICQPMRMSYFIDTYEPRYEKTGFLHMRKTKTQIS